MNREEFVQLCKYIDELQEAILIFNRSGEATMLYDVTTEIGALYGAEISGIAEALECMAQQNSLAERSGKVILALMKRFKVSDKGGGSLVKEGIDTIFLRHASSILGNTTKGLTGKEIVEHCNGYAVKFDVSIPISSADFGKFGKQVKDKSSALFQNLQAFNAKQQFQIIKELCELSRFAENEEAKRLKVRLYDSYSYLAEENLTDTALVVRTRHWLEDYPDALEVYNSALMKYERGIFERNTLDDMRLSFELLVKKILDNNRSLENQMDALGAKMKEANVSVEFRNMVSKIIEFYSKYQNNNVKHDSAVKPNEIEYVIEQTSIIMKFLIKINQVN